MKETYFVFLIRNRCQPLDSVMINNKYLLFVKYPTIRKR